LSNPLRLNSVIRAPQVGDIIISAKHQRADYITSANLVEQIREDGSVRLKCVYFPPNCSQPFNQDIKANEINGYLNRRFFLKENREVVAIGFVQTMLSEPNFKADDIFYEQVVDNSKNR
jgi:hypothetical protein